MIRITDAAQKHFFKLLKNKEEKTHIRVFVVNPGTEKAECGVSYCTSDSIESTDTELKFEKLSVFIDRVSAPYLDNAEIDLVTDRLGSQLTLRAPGIKIHKDDGGTLTERIEHLLQSKIRPKLLNHGGWVTLIEVTDDNMVILQFSGSCNGCSMIDVTLKQGIEKELLVQFPELKGVRDLTEHQRGAHSYY